MIWKHFHYGDISDIESLPSQLNHVFTNLVVNACHAIGPGRGTISIETGSEGDRAWIEITDAGSGISEENLQNIFNPFFITKPVGKGTGLSLSLSYSIVKKHEGAITVRNEVGKGATFRVVLPILQPLSTDA